MFVWCNIKIRSFLEKRMDPKTPKNIKDGRTGVSGDLIIVLDPGIITHQRWMDRQDPSLLAVIIPGSRTLLSNLQNE